LPWVRKQQGEEMKKKVRYSSTCMHLGKSLTEKLARSAEYNRRTISQEACWLMRLGMTAGKPSHDMSQLDDNEGRIQIYMEPALKAEVKKWAVEFGGSSKPQVSPVVRALIRIGFAVQSRMMNCDNCSSMWPPVKRG